MGNSQSGTKKEIAPLPQVEMPKANTSETAQDIVLNNLDLLPSILNFLSVTDLLRSRAISRTFFHSAQQNFLHFFKNTSTQLFFSPHEYIICRQHIADTIASTKNEELKNFMTLLLEKLADLFVCKSAIINPKTLIELAKKNIETAKMFLSFYQENNINNMLLDPNINQYDFFTLNDLINMWEINPEYCREFIENLKKVGTKATNDIIPTTTTISYELTPDDRIQLINPNNFKNPNAMKKIFDRTRKTERDTCNSSFMI